MNITKSNEFKKERTINFVTPVKNSRFLLKKKTYILYTLLPRQDSSEIQFLSRMTTCKNFISRQLGNTVSTVIIQDGWDVCCLANTYRIKKQLHFVDNYVTVDPIERKRKKWATKLFHPIFISHKKYWTGVKIGFTAIAIKHVFSWIDAISRIKCRLIRFGVIHL